MKVLSGLCVFLLLNSIVGTYGIYTSGNKIYYDNGQHVILRGIARPSLEWSSVGEHLSLSDYQLMQGWGANVVRIGLSQCFWLSGHSGYDSNYATLIDTQVSQITSLGMVAILDLHWSDQGNMGGSCGQQTMADSNSITFWDQVSQRYANNPLVIFELYNEPHDVSWDIWRNGGTASFTVAGMQTLYSTVRKHANNTVIVGGLSYAYDLTGISSYALTGFNIIYNTHPYDYSGKQPSDWPTYFGFLANSYPLIATEFGNYDCSTSYYSSFVTYAQSLGMSWSAWGWYVKGCDFPSLISDWNGTPNAPGAIVKAALQGNASVTTTGSATTGSNPSSTAGSSTPGTTYQVYTDQVNSPWQDYSWATTRNAADSSMAHTGSHSYSFVPYNYQAVYFYCSGCIDTTKHAGIEFYVNGGSTGNQNIHFNVVRLEGANSNKYGPDNGVATYSGSISANTWTRGYVDLSQFPSGTYDGFWFQDQSGGTQGTVYIDDVTLYAKDTSSSSSTGGNASSSTGGSSVTEGGGAPVDSTTGAEESSAGRVVAGVVLGAVVLIVNLFV